jgi:hypothetical protein
MTAMKRNRSSGAMLNAALCALICLMLCACTYKGGHTHYQVTPINSTGKLHLAQQNLYVAMPYNSGKDMAIGDAAAKIQQAMRTALDRTSGTKTYAPAARNLAEGLAGAKAAACNSFVWIEILDWYDPPASFQTSSDRGEVTLSVYDAQTGNPLQSDNVSCNGSATTVNFIGAYSPADCLKPAFDKWVDDNM